MSVHVFSDYSRDQIGFFFGMSLVELVALAVSGLPVLWAMSRQQWAVVWWFLLVFILVALVTVVKIQGRSSVGWARSMVLFAVAGLRGSRQFTARAARGQADDLGEADLPGVLQGLEIHDGPPHGPTMSRTAIIRDHAARTWAVTAAVVHPGIGMSDPADRNRQAAGLSGLLDVCSRGELIDEVIFMVRTVPDDGAERGIWVARHRVPGRSELAHRINDDLQAGLTRASVRTEAFVTFVVPEHRMGRMARESGGGVDGRGHVLHGLMGEVESQLRGGLGMTDVRWLTSPELALACRTGFAPGDRAGIVEALAAREKNPGVNADVPWAMAGPSGADAAVRHYAHDAWDSVSATVKLPVKGAVIGALAPVLTPTEAGERRSFMVAFPILTQSVAERTADNAEFASDMAGELRRKAGVKPKARHRNEAAKAQGMDEKLARGSSMTRPYAVCTVTVPRTEPITEYGRRLDAAIRMAGFAPLRLDLAQDRGFAASAIPLGVCLTRDGVA
jgi:hypothetical protein